MPRAPRKRKPPPLHKRKPVLLHAQTRPQRYKRSFPRSMHNRTPRRASPIVRRRERKMDVLHHLSPRSRQDSTSKTLTSKFRFSIPATSKFINGIMVSASAANL